MSRKAIGVLDLFDALHSGASWRAWRAFVSAVYGEPLSAEPPPMPETDSVDLGGPEFDSDLALFQRYTGREKPRPGGYAEAVAVCGVQSGKSSVVATLAGHAALTGDPGTYALMLAQDHRGAIRSLLRYAREPFERVSAFKREVERSTVDTLELKRGTFLSAYPCRPSGVRGVRACIVAIDELAFFVSSDGRPTDQEMLRVARGRVANTGGKVIVLSSPYGQSGSLYNLHKKHFGVEGSATLVWQASAPAMNPRLSEDYLTRSREEDPEAAISEVEGQFRGNLSELFDPEALDAVIMTGVRERLPVRGESYFAHFDPSGGRRDAAALAIAHGSDGIGSLDFLRAWPSPHNPADVIDQASADLKRFGLSRVQVDRFGGEYPTEQFRRNGVTAETAPSTTSDTYLAAVPLINSAAVQILDIPDLLRELRGLERRRGSGGRDRVDHQRGRHDDRAAAACGALVAVAGPERGGRAGVW